MHSTSKVTWSESTSATVRGNVIIGSGRTGASRPTNRYTRFIHRDWHVGHGLDPDSTGAPTATQPADMPLSLIHISEPTRLLSISYAVFCLKKKKKKQNKTIIFNNT